MILLHSSFRVIAALLGTSVFVVAPAAGDTASVDPRIAAYQPGAPLHGALAAAGTTEMGPMVERWAALLRQAQPGISVRVDAKGPPAAPIGLTDGTVQIGFIGRTFKEPELAAFLARHGHPPRQFRVAAGAYSDREKTSTMAIFVPRANPLPRLSLAQVDAIFSAARRRGGAGAITLWGELGLTGPWAARPIHAYTGQQGQGRLNFVREKALLDGDWSPAIRQLAHDEEVVAAVAADPGGISVASLAAGTDALRCVPLAADDRGPAYTPTLENVASELYPLSRVLYIDINAAPGRPLEPLTREFLRVALSREGQEAAQREGFLPLTAKVVEEESRKLE